MIFRNTIIKKYREHLGAVLTVADMQEHLSGVDEKAIHRIMEFLDHWGLINYQAPAEFLPSWKHPVPILVSDAALMLRALPRKGSSLYHFDTTHAPVPQQGLVKEKTTDAVIAEMLALGEGPEVEYHCNYCGADCSKQRYHCQKQVNSYILSACKLRRGFNLVRVWLYVFGTAFADTVFWICNVFITYFFPRLRMLFNVFLGAGRLILICALIVTMKSNMGPIWR